MTASSREGAARRVAVVGAGAFGVSAALALAERGHRVTVIDRGHGPHPDASSTDISKMIRMDYGADVFYHELAEAALEGWERWNAEWPRRLYHDEGFLVLASTPPQPGSFEFESARVLRVRGYRAEPIDTRTLRDRHPAWNADRYLSGYRSERGGWAESGAVVERLVALCRAAGVRFMDAHASGLIERGSRVGGVRVRRGSEEGEVRADDVVVAVGAWTPTLLPWLDDVMACVAQPVLHFGVDDPARWQPPRFPPFAADLSRTGWYGFPALDDGRLKLGHHGDGRIVQPDHRGSVDDDHVARARAFLAESIPELAGAPVVGSRVCLYCDTFDGDLWIAADPEREGLVVAAGGSGHGFKFTPMLGTLVADAVDGVRNRWLDRFRWRRRGTLRREAARLSTESTLDPGSKP